MVIIVNHEIVFSPKLVTETGVTQSFLHLTDSALWRGSFVE